MSTRTPLRDAHQVITDRIVETLKQGTVPWRVPWRTRPPRNLISDRPYRGINALLLSCSGYASPFWLTFRQAAGLGGRVRAGSKATPAVFWKIRSRDVRNDEGEVETVEIPLLRRFSLFNLEQTEGIPAERIPEIAGREFEPLDEAERIVSEMPRAPKIVHGGEGAAYRPADDTVRMPGRGSFERREDYYHVLFHELTHSTAHPSRLGRPATTRADSPEYAREELTAEMGAAFLSGRCGIEATVLEATASYLSSWLKRLREDRRLLVRAAATAQKAVDFIAGPADGEGAS